MSAPAQDDDDGYLTPAQLHKRWCGHVAEATLAQWRSRKTGPAWSKMGGRVLYAIADVKAYELAQKRGVKS